MMKKINLLIILCCLFTVPFVSAADDKNKPAVKVTTPAEKTFTTRHIWDAKVEIGEVADLGQAKYGSRRMIPITGGTFKGQDIEGIVLPGGADFQITRADGDTEFNADYMLKTNDGVIIHVTNRALFHPAEQDGKKSPPYMRSVLSLEAPSKSAYEYLNHAIFLGTLEVPTWKQGEKPYVIIGVYQLL